MLFKEFLIWAIGDQSIGTGWVKNDKKVVFIPAALLRSPWAQQVNFRAFLVLCFLALARILLSECKVAENGAQSISFHIAEDFLYLSVALNFQYSFLNKGTVQDKILIKIQGTMGHS